MKIADLKAKYDALPLSEIETTIHALQSSEMDSHRQYIAALSYLEHTGRFKDNATYARADFETYIQEVFNLSPQKFRESKLLYVKFPVEAEKYGVGYVAKAAKVCGTDKLPAIFNALKREEVKSNAPVSAKVKDTVLDANARPRPVVTYINWQERYRQVAEENNVLRAELAEKEKQIAKLQAALDRAKQQGAGLVPPAHRPGVGAGARA